MRPTSNNILDVTGRTDTKGKVWCQKKNKFVLLKRRKPDSARSGFCKYSVGLQKIGPIVEKVVDDVKRKS